MDMLEVAEIRNENLFNKYHEGHRLKEYFAQDKDLQKIIKKNNIDETKAIALVSFMFLVDHANIDMIVGHMLRYFNSVQECCDWIDKAIDWDLVDYNGKSFTSNWTIPKSMKKEFEQYQYPLPMLVLPQELTSNDSCAYLTIDKQSVFCGSTHSWEDACLKVLDVQNAIGLKLNKTVASLTKNQWKSLVGGQKPDESKEHWKEKLDQFEQYDKKARELVEDFSEYDRFYLTNKYDKRGRIYDQGYFIHSQGTDWNKGCLEFAYEEYLEEE